MILQLTYEEVTALNSAGERLLEERGGGVAAPPEALAALDARLPLQGDITVDTLDEQTRLLQAMDVVLDHLRDRVDALILERYVGADDAVNAYFDYGNVLTARHRLQQIGHEMRAVADVITDTGAEPSGGDAADAGDDPDNGDADNGSSLADVSDLTD